MVCVMNNYLILLYSVLLTANDNITTVDAFVKIDEVGNEILSIGQKIGYWIVVIVSTFQVIQASANGNRHKIGEIIFMAILTFGALFIIPYALNLVSDIF